jgi:hypothetical protein
VAKEKDRSAEFHEAIRLKIALDMRDNPSMKLKVEDILGVEYCKRNYPEAYPDAAKG